jgi:hypothetical protein
MYSMNVKDERKIPKKKTGDANHRQVVKEECPTGCGMHSLLTDGRIVWCSYVKCNYWRFANENSL